MGPGRLLRAGHDLRAAREARHEEPELSRRRPVESRRLERRAAARQLGTDRLRQRPRRPTTAATIQAPLFAYYLKDKGKLTLPEATTFETGANTWREARQLAAEDRRRRRSDCTSRPNRKLVVRRRRRSARRTAFDAYVSDPAHPVPYRQRPIMPTYGAGLEVVTLAGRGSAVSRGRADVVELGDRAADGRRRRSPATSSRTCSRRRRERCRLDREADRRLSRTTIGRTEAGRLPADGRRTTSSAAASARASRRRSRSRRTRSTSTVDLHTQNYTFHKGHRIMVQVQSTLVPAHRPQPADVRAEHLRGEGHRLQGADARDLPHRTTPRHTSKSRWWAPRCEICMRLLIAALAALPVDRGGGSAQEADVARLGGVRPVRRAGGARLARARRSRSPS